MTNRAKMLVGLAALLVLTGSATLGAWLTRDGVVARVDQDAKTLAEDADHPALVRQAQPIYYQLDPPLTVNLHDSSGGMLQAGVSLSTRYQPVSDALKNDDPAVRAVVLSILSDAPAANTLSDAGKTRLLAAIVVAVNQQLQQDGYAGQVDAAYFTTFIIQDADDDGV